MGARVFGIVTPTAAAFRWAWSDEGANVPTFAHDITPDPDCSPILQVRPLQGLYMERRAYFVSLKTQNNSSDQQGDHRPLWAATHASKSIVGSGYLYSAT